MNIGNVRLGDGALSSPSLSGDYNVGVGVAALASNASGAVNVAIGYGAMYRNVGGSHNTAVGLQALYNNTSGRHNTSVGRDSGFSNTTGDWNTNFGTDANPGNSTGIGNTVVGGEAFYGDDLADAQANQNLTGSNNTMVGRQTGSKGGAQNRQNCTAIGYRAKVDKDNQVVIGNSDVTEFKLAGVVITKAQLIALLALLP